MVTRNTDSTGAEYAAAWRQYRKLGRLRLIALFGHLPFGAAVAEATHLFHLRAPLPVLLLMPWFCFAVVALARAGSFQCPRCHHAFFYTWYLSNPLARRCLHCGLPKWAERSA